MKKSTITTTWLGGVVAIALGFVAAGVAVGLMLAYGGTFTAAPDGQGYDFVPTRDAFFWTTVGIVVAGCAVAIGGAIVQFVAWIGALVNSYQLPDKTWFAITLVLGLLGFGLVAMIAYLIGAPDSSGLERRPTSLPAPLPPAPAPTS